MLSRSVDANESLDEVGAMAVNHRWKLLPAAAAEFVECDGWRGGVLHASLGV
jgi:hypothetical protein